MAYSLYKKSDLINGVVMSVKAMIGKEITSRCRKYLGCSYSKELAIFLEIDEIILDDLEKSDDTP